jgi:hypothetical protein
MHACALGNALLIYCKLVWRASLNRTFHFRAIDVYVCLCCVQKRVKASEMAGFMGKRICIKFCFNFEKTTSETYKMFKKAFSEHAKPLDGIHVSNWPDYLQ